MQKFSLEALGHQLLERVGAASGGHTADTVVGGHERILRQTVIAMLSAPSLLSMRTRARRPCTSCADECGCRPGELSWEGRSGDLLVVPDARHSLEALEASAVRQAALTASQVQQAVSLPEVPGHDPRRARRT